MSATCFILTWSVQSEWPDTLGQLTLKLTFNKATLHHVEEDCDHDVQQLTLLSHMSSQLLVAEQLHTNMYNAVGHGVRLVAFHQCFHDECIMLNKGFRKSDLSDRMRNNKSKLTAPTFLLVNVCRHHLNLPESLYHDMQRNYIATEGQVCICYLQINVNMARKITL